MAYYIVSGRLNMKFRGIIYFVAILSSQSVLAKKIEIDGTNQKTGTIESHDFPYTYVYPIDEEFHFYSNNKNERIQIIFDVFSLYHDDKDYERGAACENQHSYISYSADKWNPRGSEIRVCQNGRPIMSDDNRFVLKFIASGIKPTQSKEEFMGFNATYKFITNYGINSGMQLENDCQFIYNSSVSSNGTFNSPNYPGYYPDNLKCTYIFVWDEAEYLNITFNHFTLLGNEECTYISGTDYVVVSCSDDESLCYDMMCGTKNSFSKSPINGTFFMVTFQSHNERANSSITQPVTPIGFNASYFYYGPNPNKGTITEFTDTKTIPPHLGCDEKLELGSFSVNFCNITDDPV